MIGISGQQSPRLHMYGAIQVTKKKDSIVSFFCRCRKVLATGHEKEEAHDKLLSHALRNTRSQWNNSRHSEVCTWNASTAQDYAAHGCAQACFPLLKKRILFFSVLS